MNILVLSLTKKLRKPDKTEYLDKFEALKSDSRSVEVKEIFDNAVLLEHELKKAAKAKPDLIITRTPSVRGSPSSSETRSAKSSLCPRQRKRASAKRARR